MIGQVMNADCLEVMKMIPDKAIDLVLTDPPYGMDYLSSWRKDKYKKIQGDTDLWWLDEVLLQCYRILKDNTHCYIFCNDYAISEIRKAAEVVGFTAKRALVWVKNNHTSGDLLGDFGNKTEFIIFLHKGRRELNGHRDTNVLLFDRVECDNHPTKKPQELMNYLLLKSTEVGDLVFDGFSGSFTTARACKDLGRRWICCDLEEEYCAIGEERLRQELLF